MQQPIHRGQHWIEILYGDYGCCPQLCLLCIDSLLCRRDGEAQGDGTEVRGAGTGHLRTGSSTMLLGSILSIIYSAVRVEARREWRMRSNDRREKRETRRGNQKQRIGTSQRRGGVGMKSGGGGGEKREENHFRGVTADQYSSTAIRTRKQLCCWI